MKRAREIEEGLTKSQINALLNFAKTCMKENKQLERSENKSKYNPRARKRVADEKNTSKELYNWQDLKVARKLEVMEGTENIMIWGYGIHIDIIERQENRLCKSDRIERREEKNIDKGERGIKVCGESERGDLARERERERKRGAK